MKQLLSLFLFLLPCLALAQYPSNGNQKITLGEQTTADGLIFRGVAADTTLTAKSDTAAYFVLDTANLNLYTYKASATGKKWIQLGSDTTSLNLVSRFAAKLNISDTASMLTNYYRSGRTGIIQASDVPTLNQNTTGSAATLTTSRTFQTNLASTSTASFNGSANVTPGVTGTLPVANGGTGSTTQNFVDLTTTQTVAGAKTFSNAATFSSTINSGDITTNGNNKGIYFNGTRNAILGNTSPEEIRFATANADRVIISATGAFTINDLAGINDVGADANGKLQAATSDMNLKNTIENSPFGLNEILLLNPVTFLYNDTNRKIDSDIKEVGFIAQDVFDIIPNAVSSTGTGDLQLDYRAITATLVKAIQEQNLLIKALEQRIINLENK
jgi:hypothetical protein